MNNIEQFCFLNNLLDFEDYLYKDTICSKTRGAAALMTKRADNLANNLNNKSGANKKMHSNSNTNSDNKANNEQSELTNLNIEAESCRACSLHTTRNKLVFGKGSPNPSIVFVGEAPGADEDKIGFPFVGRAGKLLDKWFEKYNLTLEDIYVMNALKCRPPNNRDPLPEEKAACKGYFDKQLAILKPKVICALGRHALSNLLDTEISSRYSDMRGVVHSYNGIKVVATYHPAFILRSGQFAQKVYDDFDLMLKLLL